MTGDPSMTARMWKAFTGDRYISDVPFSRITHYGSSIGRLCGMVSPIRTVQAAEITDEPPQSENPNQNRPAVYISHDEVNRIIQRETGMDRLKDFFTRRYENDEEDGFGVKSILKQAFREFLVSPALIRNYKAVISISFI